MDDDLDFCIISDFEPDYDEGLLFDLPEPDLDYDGGGVEFDVSDCMNPYHENDNYLKPTTSRIPNIAKPIKQNSPQKSQTTFKRESQKLLSADVHSVFKDFIIKKQTLDAGLSAIPKKKQTSGVEKILKQISEDDDHLEEIVRKVKYVGYKPSQTDEQFTKVKDDKKMGNKAFLIYLFLTRGSNIDLIKNTSDKRTKEKLTKLQNLYNLQSKVTDCGPKALTLSRIAMAYPTVVASMLHKFDENKVRRPVTKKMLKKICGADFPSVLMSNIVASLLPKDTKVLSKDNSQKIRNAIVLYTALEAQKTKRSFSEKDLQECVHLNAKYATLAYNSDFISEKERQSAFKKPYFKYVYNNRKLSNEVIKIDQYMQRIIDKIKKNDPLFKI